MIKTFTSKSIGDQKELLSELNRLSKTHSIILFKGEMGAGKTTVIKNFCNFIGVVDDVSSPTYSLVNEYQKESGETIYHFDFYRIENEDEALDMGVEEYLNSNNLCLIEWAENIKNLLPENCLTVNIKEENKQREIILSTNNLQWKKMS